MILPAATTSPPPRGLSRRARALRAVVAASLFFGLAAAFCEPVRAGVAGELDVFIELPDEDGDFRRQTDPTLLRRHFNHARCVCSEQGAAFDDVDYSTIRVRLEGSYTLAPNSPRTSANLDVGGDCISQEVELREPNCENLREIGDIVAARGESFEVPLHRFMFSEGACLQTTKATRAWITFDDDTNGIPDEQYFATEVIDVDAEPPPAPLDPRAEAGEGAVVVSWDNPESRVTDIEFYQVLCIEDGATTPVMAQVDRAEYETTQDLCGVSGSAVAMRDASGRHGSYLGGTDAGASDAGMTDAGAEPDAGGSAVPAPLGELDPRFICATTTGTDESVRVAGLQNGVDYHFVLVSIDEVGNYTPTYVGTAQPSQVIDLWEEYQRGGGSAEGGVCLVTSTFGDDHWFTRTLRDFRDRTLAHFGLGRALSELYYDYVAPLGALAERSTIARIGFAALLTPLVAAAALWEYTGPEIKLLLVLVAVLWLRRRRRARRARASGADESPAPWRAWRWQLAAAGCAAVWLAATPAAAQSPFDSYWEEFEPTPPADAATLSKWNLGIKAGPYLPDIDSDVSRADAGPWDRVFGSPGVRVDIELDRYFLWPAGQLGATVSLGFMGKSGHAIATVACSDPPSADPDCINGVKPDTDDDGDLVVSAEITSFRLVPVSVGVVYRITALDDHLRVPLIPYGKAGLSYYLWWITAPGGGVSEAPTADCPDPADSAADCDGNRALGASIGYQVTVGVALRAERLDRRAALSLRNDMGIEHAGFYGEVTYAQVDGFGSDSRLPVGDLTWFAGLNFEF